MKEEKERYSLLPLCLVMNHKILQKLAFYSTKLSVPMYTSTFQRVMQREGKSERKGGRGGGGFNDKIIPKVASPMSMKKI